MLINKNDFTSDLVEFSIHTPDEKLNPAIAKTIRFDLPDALPDELYKDLLKLDGLTGNGQLTYSEWNKDNSYAEDAYVLLEGNIYKALSDNTNSEPGLTENGQSEEESTNWQYEDLATFFHGYVKPYLVMAAYVRLLGVTNAQYTGSGLRQFHENDSQPASPAAYADYISTHKKDATRLLKEMSSELNKRSYIISGKEYTKNTQELKKSTSSGYSAKIKAIR